MTEPEKMEMISNLKHGIPMATPVFDGATGDDINSMLSMAGLPTSGQIDLYDGRTGEKFDRKVTVGVMYMIVIVTLSRVAKKIEHKINIENK